MVTDAGETKLSKMASVMDAALQVFQNHRGIKLSKRDIDSAIEYNGYSPSVFSRAMQALIADGHIKQSGTTKNTVYWMPDEDESKVPAEHPGGD